MVVSCRARTLPRHRNTSGSTGNIPNRSFKDQRSEPAGSDGGYSPVPQNKRKLQECQTVGEGSEPKSRNPKRQVPNSHADTPPDGSMSHPLLVSDDDNDKGDKISSPTSPDLSQDTLPDSEEFREKIDNHFSAKSEKAQLREDSSGTEPRPNTGIADSTVRNSPTCAQHPGVSCIAVGTKSHDTEITNKLDRP